MGVGDLPRVLDVAAHLLDQRVRILEASLAAKPREELQAQLTPVQVTVEVEDVRLDQLAKDARALEVRGSSGKGEWLLLRDASRRVQRR